MVCDRCPLPWLGIVLLEYHVSEALLVRYFTPEEFGFGSFLFSLPYLVAMLSGVVEFQLWCASGRGGPSGSCPWPFAVGMVMVLVGEGLRKAAWLSAGPAFTHQIKREKRAQHQLVTTGVYGIARHPGYLGWFFFFVGTQVMVSNMVCTVLFAVVAYRFFSIRIPIEDKFLRSMFGADFAEYYKRTPTRFPGIR